MTDYYFALTRYSEGFEFGEQSAFVCFLFFALRAP